MVIERVLKVNSSDPKIDELRRKLAAMQQAAGQAPPSAQPATAPQNQPQPAPMTPPPPQIAAQPPAQTVPLTPQARSQAEIAQLAKLSFEEQKRLAERGNPEIRLKEERTINLVMGQIRELINLSTEANKRIKELELKSVDVQKQLDGFKDKNEETLQKMNSIDSRLEKFMGLYELITNQYNPFTENVKLPQLSQFGAGQAPTPAKPVPKAGTFAVSDSLTNTTANVEVNKEDADLAAHNFQRVEQLLAQLHKETHTQPPPNPRPQAPAQLDSEIHGLLAGFEERLKKQFDSSLQVQLHQRFSQLETHLQEEIRDALREEIEKLQQEDTAIQQTMAELQQLVQAKENSNRAVVEDEFSELSQQVTRVRDEVKAIPPSLYFRLSDGGILRDIHELSAAVMRMSPQTFFAHVTTTRNDFADWVEKALGLAQHAAAIRQATTVEQLRQMFVNAG